MVDRRSFLRLTGTAATLSVAGCIGSAAQEDGNGTTASEGEGCVTEVAVGPEKRLRFEPEQIEIQVCDAVRWTAMSTGHNVTTKPGSSDKVSIPEDAEPFASYYGEDHFSIMPVDATFEHVFEVPGEYTYVCAPHAGQGMVGQITVTE